MVHTAYYSAANDSHTVVIWIKEGDGRGETPVWTPFE